MVVGSIFREFKVNHNKGTRRNVVVAPEREVIAMHKQHCRVGIQAWDYDRSDATAVPKIGRTRMTQRLQLQVNGRAVSAEVSATTLLSTFLREQLRLTGTHIGCDTASVHARL